MLIEGFKHLNVYLILAQKFSNIFISFNKAVEIFGNFLRITHQIISPILNFYAIWRLQMPKYPSKISPKIPQTFFQAFIGLLGFLDHFENNTHLNIFSSLIFLPDR